MSTILILGNGGREHALAWKLSQSSEVKTVFVVPGNGAEFPTLDIDVSDLPVLVDAIHKNEISLVIIGPEKLLAIGVVDYIRANCPKVAVFGPNKIDAQLETSKSYAKNIIEKLELLTAPGKLVENKSELETVLKSWDKRGVVVKADGLAEGKGVLVTSDLKSAFNFGVDILEGKYGSSRKVLVEEMLNGYEISALSFISNGKYELMPLARDHKRLLEDDQGPNTGGMGVIAPVPVSETLLKKIRLIFEKFSQYLKSSYVGVLYAGLMIVDDEPYILEFNCRFGDPETQVLMKLLQSDLYRIILGATEGNLPEIEWSDKFSCGVVVASKDYPFKSDSGSKIEFVPEDNESVTIFHAGTQKIENKLFTRGGRIFCVTSLAQTLPTSRNLANQFSGFIKFHGAKFRKDIGIERSTTSALTYNDSGVNIDEGNAFVNDIKSLVQKTLRPGTSQIGGFGAIVDLATCGFPNNAQLVIGIDGVGTKIEIASLMNNFNNVGYDVVGMCVNDVLCHCAKPIAFLDYYVCGRLNRKQAVAVVDSISRACIEAECSLIGGETAEMPGVYDEQQWDLAGCCIAARENSWPYLPSSQLSEGDSVLGLPSNGLHSNGFSLVRKVMRKSGVSYFDKTPWNENLSFGEELLKPTRLYVKDCLPLMKKGWIKAAAHITGGGLVENAPRIFSKDSDLFIDITNNSWKIPDIFVWIAKNGPVEESELLKTFNCGLGMILVVPKEHVQDVLSGIESAVFVGSIQKKESRNSPSIRFQNPHVQLPKQDRKIKVGILISGTGSNMQKLIEKSLQPGSPCEISVVISNKKDAAGLARAQSFGIATEVIPHTADRITGDKNLAEKLAEYKVELICLAGYMRILSAEFVAKYEQRILNVHPSLLPSFPGAHAPRDALAFGARISGCTVHFVDEKVDHGPIISQASVPIKENDTAERLQKRIQQVEYKLYPDALFTVARKMLG